MQAMAADGQGAAVPARGATVFLGLERPSRAMRVVYEVVRILLLAAAMAGAAQPFVHRAGLASPFDVTLR